MRRHYRDDGFEFARLNLLGSAYRGLADVGEVLVTLDRVHDGDREAWITELTALGERLEAQARQSLAGGHRVSARTAFLRASTYFDQASAMAPGTSGPDRYHTLWERHRACWDAAAPLHDPPVERVAIPYEGTTLEGYLFRPHGDRARPRPTVILNNGSDGSVGDMWRAGGAAAVERGWNALTFDGPGQGAAFHRDHLCFRADWEAVVTPVVDWLVARPEVDAERMALHGVSQAGYWVPRAVAFEHRIAAAVADPGVTSVAASWRKHIPDFLLDLFDEGDKAGYDQLMEAGMEADPGVRGVLAWRMAPYGVTSPFDALAAATAMHLDDATIAAIRCPVLVTDPDHEQFWPGQSAELAAKLTSPVELVRFTAHEGADWHCEPAAAGLRDERVFDWLEDVLADPAPR